MDLLVNMFFAPLRLLAWIIFRLMGWQVQGELPKDPKLVVTGAPHTSNWDFLIAVLGAWVIGRRLNVTIKDELFFPPLGWILRAIGGVPIDRRSSHNFVEQVAQRFEETDRMMMVFTPEGTRSYTDYWKTGFYWAALEAGVPIWNVAIDWENKRLHVSDVHQPTGDIEADFAIYRAFQEEKGHGLKPENESKIVIRPRKAETEDTATVA